jgi:hypothetical protein
MPNKYSKDEAGSVGKFLKEPFDGLQKDFQSLMDEIRTAVATLKHSDSLEFLFPANWYQRDPANQDNFILPLKYQKLENVPVLYGVAQIQATDANGNLRFNAGGNPVMRNVTAEDRSEAKDYNKYINEFNQRLTDLNADCLSEITRRVSPSINLALNKLSGNVLECKDYLEVNFGTGATIGNAVGQTIVNMIMNPMKWNEHWSDFILRFERDGDFCELNDNVKLGILCMDGKNQYHLQVLPDRLIPTVENILRERKSYDEAKDSLNQMSQL